MNPAQVAYLLKPQEIDTDDAFLLATIIDLQMRGNLAGDGYANLEDFEKAVVKGIFNKSTAYSASAVRYGKALVSSMTNPPEETAYIELTNELVIPISYKVLAAMKIESGFRGQAENLESQNKTTAEQLKTIFKYALMPVALMIASVPILFVLSYFGIDIEVNMTEAELEAAIGSIFLAIFAVAVVIIVTTMLLGRIADIRIRAKLYREEKDSYAIIFGYKEYLEVVEKDNIEFEIKEHKEPIENKHLPFAVALGVIKPRNLTEILVGINPSEYSKLIEKSEFPPFAKEIDAATKIQL